MPFQTGTEAQVVVASPPGFAAAHLVRRATPIVSGGQIVVPESTYVQGVVSHSRESGRVKGRAELGIRIEKMTLAGRKVIQVNPYLSSVDAGGTSPKSG
jgi:hypothetical protein